MKLASLLTGIIIGGVLGFFLTKVFNHGDGGRLSTPGKGLPNAPEIRGGSKWEWADSLDAVKAAPKNHHVLFENDKVRILEVLLRPHEFEPMHTHRLESVMFGPSDGDTSHFDIIYYRYSYDPVKQKYFIKDSIKQHNGGYDPKEPNQGDFMKPEGPHRIKNMSNITIDAFRVEFKPGNKK